MFLPGLWFLRLFFMVRNSVLNTNSSVLFSPFFSLPLRLLEHFELDIASCICTGGLRFEID